MFKAYKIFPLGVICGSLGTHAYNCYKNDKNNKFLYAKKLQQLNKETKEIQEETRKVIEQTDDILQKIDKQSDD